MLICTDCGAVFSEDEVKTVYENHPYGDGYATEKFSVCPSCGESGIEEAVQCNLCGEYGHRDSFEMDENLNYLCEVCYEDLYG